MGICVRKIVGLEGGPLTAIPGGEDLQQSRILALRVGLEHLIVEPWDEA